MSTISLKLQARPRTAPSTRDRKIGRLSRSDSQISLTSSIGTGRDSRTIGPSSGWILQLKGPWLPEKDRIVARSRHKTRIYQLHRIVRQVPTRRWVRIKFYGTFVDQSFRYAIEIASFWVGFIFDKSSGFVMSRVGSKVDGRRTGIKILFCYLNRLFSWTAQFDTYGLSGSMDRWLDPNGWSCGKTGHGTFCERGQNYLGNFQLTNVPSMSNSISNNSTATNVTNQSQGSPDKLYRLQIELVLRALIQAWLDLIQTPVWIHVLVWQVR